MPQTIVVDNGPEFAGRTLDAWVYAHGVTLRFIRPGKPIENAYVESFNGKFRDECLNEQWFVNLVDAKATIEAWRVDYNTVRPHSSLNGATPDQFARISAGARRLTPAQGAIEWERATAERLKNVERAIRIARKMQEGAVDGALVGRLMAHHANLQHGELHLTNVDVEDDDDDDSFKCVCDSCAGSFVEALEPGSAEGATSDHFGRHVTDEQLQRDGLLMRRPRIEYGAPVTRNMWPKSRNKK